jgi:hypothetical protein
MDHRCLIKYVDQGCLIKQITETRRKITENCRKLPNEELCYWGSSYNIIRIIESWSTQWAGQVAHMGDIKIKDIDLARHT